MVEGDLELVDGGGCLCRGLRLRRGLFGGFERWRAGPLCEQLAAALEGFVAQCYAEVAVAGVADQAFGVQPVERVPRQRFSGTMTAEFFFEAVGPEQGQYEFVQAIVVEGCVSGHGRIRRLLARHTL